MQKIRLVILLLLMPFILLCQNLTGTWEGNMGDQLLQVNIMHTPKGICGYSYDYLYNNKRNNCRAYFDANWDDKKKQLKLTGTKMIENSGSHVLMRLNFVYDNDAEGEYLIGKSTPKSTILKIMSLGASATSIVLRKVSNKPAPYYKDMFAACMEDSVKKDTVVATPTLPIKKDTVAIVKPNVITYTKPIEKKVIERKNEVISIIKTQSNILTVKLYDNGTIDGDTVSVFHNGKLLVSHQLLSEKAYTISIDLSKENPRHEILLFAENLGSIPPNTALLVVEAGNKRYELRASADLSKNASLIFEYDPTVK